MTDSPGVQYAVYDTVEDRIVRTIAYQEAFDWDQDYKAGNSRYAVVTRRVPKWEYFQAPTWRQG